MEEQTERPELPAYEMSGFAAADGPGPEGDADAPDNMQEAPADVPDIPDAPDDLHEAARAGERRPATGEPRVDAALARLDELAGSPVSEHRAVFEDVHRRLRDVLGELDTREQNPGSQSAAGAERRAGR